MNLTGGNSKWSFIFRYLIVVIWRFAMIISGITVIIFYLIVQIVGVIGDIECCTSQFFESGALNFLITYKSGNVQTIS
jgi:hypothetical protein